MASSSQIVNVYQRVSFIHHIFPINHHSKTIYIYIIFPYIFPIKSHQPSRNEEGPVLVSARTSPSRTSIHDLGWDCGETWFSLFFAFHWQKQLKFEQENEWVYQHPGKKKTLRLEHDLTNKPLRFKQQKWWILLNSYDFTSLKQNMFLQLDKK